MWHKKKAKDAPAQIAQKVEDRRPILGGDATLENAGPSRGGHIDAEEIDTIEGTTSGTGLRGKPDVGKREAIPK